jgi:hypothetical protein
MLSLIDDDDRAKQRKSIFLVCAIAWALSYNRLAANLGLDSLFSALPSNQESLALCTLVLAYLSFRFVLGIGEDLFGNNQKLRAIENTKVALLILQPHCQNIEGELNSISKNLTEALDRSEQIKATISSISPIADHVRAIGNERRLVTEVMELSQILAGLNIVSQDLKQIYLTLSSPESRSSHAGHTEWLKNQVEAIGAISDRFMAHTERAFSYSNSSDQAFDDGGQLSVATQDSILGNAEGNIRFLDQQLKDFSTTASAIKQSCGFEISREAIQRANALTRGTRFEAISVLFAHGVTIFILIATLMMAAEKGALTTLFSTATDFLNV